MGSNVKQFSLLIINMSNNQLSVFIFKRDTTLVCSSLFFICANDQMIKYNKREGKKA